MLLTADTIDRIAPTLRPSGRTVMRQRWAELGFLHWEVQPDALRSQLPPGLTLDTFEGRAFVGLVPFTMTGVRPTVLPPFPPLSNFHEVNVRTYVHHEGRNPGVWFFSLDAANAMAVRLARAWFKLPYHYARMRLTKTGETVDYASERLWPEPTPAECRLCYTPSGPVTPASPGSLEHFLAERYFLYAYKNGVLYRGQVHHPPYPLQTAVVSHLEESLIAAAGIARPETPPLAHYAREVRVHIFPLQRVAIP